MKNFLAVAAVCLLAAPAFGGEVPESTLSAVGLGDMQVLTDADGMQVRGMSSNSQATSFSSISTFLFDPNTGASLAFNGTDFARTTAENAGLNAVSTSTASSTVSQGPIVAAITFNGITWSANLGALNVNGLASGTSF